MIVLDSSFLIAFHDELDNHHRSARAAMDRLLDGAWGKGLLLDHIFIEVVTVLKRKRSNRLALYAGAELWKARELDFVATSDLFRPIWNQFQADYLSNLSFVDHAVALTATQRAGGKVLTFDKAFREIPGIVVLPES